MFKITEKFNADKELYLFTIKKIYPYLLSFRECHPPLENDRKSRKVHKTPPGRQGCVKNVNKYPGGQMRAFFSPPR
jgi:hypothetical protein